MKEYFEHGENMQKVILTCPFSIARSNLAPNEILLGRSAQIWGAAAASRLGTSPSVPLLPPLLTLLTKKQTAT